MLRLAVGAVAVVLLAGCDSADNEDDSPFYQLQGTWERTDAGVTNQSVRFGPGQNYAFRVDGDVVERGLYAVLSQPGDAEITVRYMSDGTAPPGDVGQPGGRPRPDETAQITDDTLVLTPPNGSARTYRRD